MKPLIYCAALAVIAPLAHADSNSNSAGVPASVGAAKTVVLPATYDLSGLDQKPVLKRHTQNFYPVTLKDSHKMGGVILELIVDPSGAVSSVRVVKSAAFEYNNPMEPAFAASGGTTTATAHASGYQGPGDAQTSDSALEHTDSAAFQRAALRAAQQWRFEPGKKDGHPVSARLLAQISFTQDGWSYIKGFQ